MHCLREASSVSRSTDMCDVRSWCNDYTRAIAHQLWVTQRPRRHSSCQSVSTIYWSIVKYTIGQLTCRWCELYLYEVALVNHRYVTWNSWFRSYHLVLATVLFEKQSCSGLSKQAGFATTCSWVFPAHLLTKSIPCNPCSLFFLASVFPQRQSQHISSWERDLDIYW